MAVEGCGKFLKFIVFFFNFLVFVGGIAVLGVGIWSLVDSNALGEIGTILGQDMFSTATYILIAVGVILLLLGFLGCCGAWKESKCLLGLFFFILFIMFIVLLAGGILAFVYNDKVKSALEKEMNTTLVEKYDDTSKDKDIIAFTDAWNVLQTTYKCCGIKGNRTGDNSYYKWQSSQWFKKQTGSSKKYVPTSCCNTKNATDVKVCDGETKLADAPPVNHPGTKENKYLNVDGCYNAVEAFVNAKAPIIGGVACGIAVLMLIALLLSICLCRSIKPNYDQYA